MSDTSILPNATPATDAGIDMVPPGTDVEESGSGDRRRLMILGGVAAVVVVAAAGFMLLHKGSSSTPTGLVPHAVVPSAPTQAATGGSHQSAKSGSAGGHSSASTPSGPSSLPKVANHTTARDPFHPLVIDPLTTSGGATSTTTVNASTTTDGQTTATTGSTPSSGSTDGSTGTTPGTGTTTGTTTSAAATPLWIQLMNVHGRIATFDVGYAHHKFRRFHVQAPRAGVHQATVFDKVFALVSVKGGQVSLQIGDDAPFQLVTGIAHTVGS